MLEIYFDGVLIEQDYYKSLSNDFKLFTDTFKLGGTSANTFNFSLPKQAVNSIPDKIAIKLNGIDYGNVVIDKAELKDDKFYEFTLTDSMLLFNFEYNASPIVPCSNLELLKDICSKKGIELATTDFINKDDIVDWYDNRVTARTYISYIAESACGFAQIGQDGKLYIKKFTDRPVYEIDLDKCENFKIGEYHKIERVVFDNGLLKFETSTDETLETLYLNSENVFINTQETFDNIANEILGFDYYSFETGKCEINPNIIAGDRLKFIDGENEYYSIAQYSLNFIGQWMGGYSLNLNSKKQEETKQVGTKESIKNLQVELNRTKNELKIVVEETSETTLKVDKAVNEVDSLSSTLNNNYLTAEQVEALTNGNAEEINIVKTELTQQILNSTSMQIQIQEIYESGVNRIVTSTGYTFDKEGLKISKEGEEMNVLIDNTGMFTKRDNEIVFQADNNGVEAENITVRKYLVIGDNLRVENYKGNRTGFFYIGVD